IAPATSICRPADLFFPINWLRAICRGPLAIERFKLTGSNSSFGRNNPASSPQIFMTRPACERRPESPDPRMPPSNPTPVLLTFVSVLEGSLPPFFFATNPAMVPVKLPLQLPRCACSNPAPESVPEPESRPITSYLSGGGG